MPLKGLSPSTLERLARIAHVRPRRGGTARLTKTPTNEKRPRLGASWAIGWPIAGSVPDLGQVVEMLQGVLVHRRGQGVRPLADAGQAAPLGQEGQSHVDL